MSRRLTGLLVVIALAGALAPAALAKRKPHSPTSPTYVAPGSSGAGGGAAAMVDIEALKW